ncbi:MAG: polyprenyl synthetase family protein [Acidobacteria bacterium]|nr:polyprenyl synthetase family protein [Acidobacteriota bacterium]
MSAPDFATFADACRRDLEQALERWLPTPPDCPSRLHEVMRYSLLAGGKRLRPVLVQAAADAVAQGHPDARTLALPAACALEMIHTYSLVHDDLPAMDNDTLRRGRATAHVVYGDALAILSGDGLLTEAFALLAREPSLDSPAIAQRKLLTMALIAASAGVSGMVGGQVLDLQWEGAPRQAVIDDDLARLQDVHARKTGALIRASTGAGAIMAGAAPDAVAAIDAYGTELGLCFQIVDDVLDVEGTADELGKHAGKDEAAGKLTYPALFGVDGSRRRAEGCVTRGRAALDRAGLSGHLPAVLDWALTRRT